MQEDLRFRRFKARHPNWSGTLLLSKTTDEIVHEQHKTRGTYEISSNVLNIFWDNYPDETYYLVVDTYFQSSLIEDIKTRSFPIGRLSSAHAYGLDVTIKKLTVCIPGTDYEVTLRTRSSDLPTFGQIFCNKEYDSPNLPAQASKIVDLGANIGLGTVYFGNRYPEAEILAVEPDQSNFSLLELNICALGRRVQARKAAVWTDDGVVNLQMETQDGRDLGDWGRQVSEIETKSSKQVSCYKIDTLLDGAGFEEVDILKIDIEGAEMEIFSKGVESWIGRVNFIIIETHDRFRPGSDLAVRNALSAKFRELPKNGENLFFERIK